MHPDPWIKDLKNWSILYPYEYSSWANQSWYGNFDWQRDGDQENGHFIGDDQSRYLGKHNEWVDRSSDTNEEYGEKSLKVRSPGWYNWLGDQMDRAVASGVGYMEFDNLDNALERDRSVVMETYYKAISMGLKPILKNPTPRDIKEFASLTVAGCVFEHGTMPPLAFDDARKDVNPTLLATWVRHGGNINGQDIPNLCKQCHKVSGTSIQWGPREYNKMRILVHNP